jgi:hypothetical protein
MELGCRNDSTVNENVTFSAVDESKIPPGIEIDNMGNGV